jgi:hypothetical protein
VKISTDGTIYDHQFKILFLVSAYSIIVLSWTIGNQMTNILIGATGSVAAIKIPLLVSLLKKVGGFFLFDRSPALTF